MSLDSAIQHALKAKRIVAASQSYAKDNPLEWEKVKAYLEGGPRPSGVATEMGLFLIEVEDERRGVPPPPPPPPVDAYFYWEGDTLPGPFRVAEPSIGSSTFSKYIHLIDSGQATRLMADANGGQIWTWGIKTCLSEDRRWDHGSIGKETWYRCRMRFPSEHYFPAKGEFNLLQQWHCHSGLMGTGSYNTFVGMRCDSAAQNPRLFLMMRAGRFSSGRPAIDQIVDPFPPNSLVRDRWYDSLVRIKWYPDNRGSISWYVDGVLKYESVAIPTLLQTASGVNDIVDYQIDNYRGNDVTTESWVDFNLVAAGPTRASVGA